jgi:histidinol-phosphate aminotransferase
MTMAMKVRPAVAAATRFTIDTAGLDRSTYIRLDCNESTRPLSTHVADAIAARVRDLGVHLYPDDTALTAAIAAYCSVSQDAVLATNGSDQAIDICVRTFLQPGATMLIARPEFPIFTHHAGLAEARVRGVPFGPELDFPYDDFRAALAQRPDLIVLINPNNPTGTPVRLDFIAEVADRWSDVPVIVDEAYAEFTGVTAIPMLAAHPNLVAVRTFSKAFAMAGLRLGYLVADPEVIAQLGKLRNPFDINMVATTAALTQLAHLDEVRAYTHEVMTIVKPLVVDFFEAHGVTCWPGAANFVLVRPDDCDAYVQALRDERILVRRIGAPGLSDTFRMSLGTQAEMERVLEVYAGLLSARVTTGSV